MKDDHQKDHLEVGLTTPDGRFYTVIPSRFLWTTLPLPPGKNSLVKTKKKKENLNPNFTIMGTH